MNADEILEAFLKPASDIENIFDGLNTYNRPSLPDEDDGFYDWLLVRSKGVELGFTESNYYYSKDEWDWGRGELILTQAYFYSASEGIKEYTGKLPFNLLFSDDKESAREKLKHYEPSRHSFITDVWDIGNYRLTISYREKEGIDTVICRSLPLPISVENNTVPDVQKIISCFGCEVADHDFRLLWAGSLDKESIAEAKEDGSIDFTKSFGATLNFSKTRKGPLLTSITLHRNRDLESMGWSGELPNQLDFEDSPEALFQKIPEKPIKQSDSQLTGFAVWNFDGYTLHVLYSNIDNRLIRVALIAPGVWKSIDEFSNTCV